jgi:hypothetical protein
MDDVAQLTSAYVEVRYAEQAASADEIAAAREQLGRLHARTP